MKQEFIGTLENRATALLTAAALTVGVASIYSDSSEAHRSPEKEVLGNMAIDHFSDLKPLPAKAVFHINLNAEMVSA